MSKSDELTELIRDFAADLAGPLPDPGVWGIWLGFLLEELERLAAKSRKPLERFDLWVGLGPCQCSRTPTACIEE